MKNKKKKKKKKKTINGEVVDTEAFLSKHIPSKTDGSKTVALRKDAPANKVGNLPYKEPTDKCNSRYRTRKGHRYCKNDAGHRTDHPGVGRCYKHGGMSVVKAGRYSTVLSTELQDALEQEHMRMDSEGLSVKDELALLRTILEKVLLTEKDEEGEESLDLGLITSTVRSIKDLVETELKTKQHSSISMKRFNEIMFAIIEILKRHITDPSTLKRINEDMSRIRVN